MRSRLSMALMLAAALPGLSIADAAAFDSASGFAPPRPAKGHGRTLTPKQELEGEPVSRPLTDSDRAALDAAAAKRARRAAKRSAR